MTLYQILFPNTAFADLRLPAHTPLSQHLDPSNSPVLFGCRAGLCGTCICRVRVVSGVLARPRTEEAEALDVYADGEPGMRLACQLDLTADIAIEVP